MRYAREDSQGTDLGQGTRRNDRRRLTQLRSLYPEILQATENGMGRSTSIAVKRKCLAVDVTVNVAHPERNLYFQALIRPGDN